MRGMSWLAENQLASQEGFCFMEQANKQALPFHLPLAFVTRQLPWSGEQNRARPSHVPICATFKQTPNIYLQAEPTKQAVAVPWPFAAKNSSFVAASGTKNPPRLFLMVCYVATLCASGLASFSQAPASLAGMRCTGQLGWLAGRSCLSFYLPSNPDGRT
jgi:hypothetical protein